jgi:hypothetical protein
MKGNDNMIIQELIDKLNKIEDKTKTIGIITQNLYGEICSRDFNAHIKEENKKSLEKHKFDYYI